MFLGLIVCPRHANFEDVTAKKLVLLVNVKVAESKLFMRLESFFKIKKIEVFSILF